MRDYTAWLQRIDDRHDRNMARINETARLAYAANKLAADTAIAKIKREGAQIRAILDRRLGPNSKCVN